MVCGDAFSSASSARYSSICRRSSDMNRQMLVQRHQGAAADLRVAGSFVATQGARGFRIERRQQIEGNVRRLVMVGIRRRDVVTQRPERRFARKLAQWFARGQRCGVATGDKAGCDRLDVAFDAGNLAGEKQLRPRAKLQCSREQRRSVDIRIPVDLAIAQKFSALQARDHSEYALLLGKAHEVLKAETVIAVCAQILLPQLHYRPRPFAGPGVNETRWLHRAEAQRVESATRDFLDRQTGFEVTRPVLFNVKWDRFCGPYRIHETLILLAIEWTVDVVIRGVQRFAVARCAERDGHINGVGVDDRTDRVIEEQPV